MRLLSYFQEEIDEAARNKASIRDLISSKANIKALIVSLGLMIFQQLSGVNAVIFYASSIFEAAGSSLDSSICAIIVGVVQVIHYHQCANSQPMQKSFKKMFLIYSKFKI